MRARSISGTVSIGLAHHRTGTDLDKTLLRADKALYLAAVRANKPVYSRTGVIPAAGMTSAADMLLAFDDELKDAKVDLAKTFDDRFAKKAVETVK